MATPRGIRNNNPLNIRRGSEWQGLRKKQQDPEFCQFTSASLGYRAAFRLLNTYYTKYRLTNLKAIIERFAPPVENNTLMYIVTVKHYFLQYTGKMLNEVETLPPVDHDQKTWCAIVRAMVAMECGAKWADDVSTPGLISSGYKIAFNN